MEKPLNDETKKPTKTISGVTPVAVMLPPRKCNHGVCAYCPSMGVPQSYTPRSPVVMRAFRVGYDPFKQVYERLKAFRIMNHPVDKVEVIIMGGTFLEYEEKFQDEFIKGIYDGLNGKKSKTLNQAQKSNETAECRCVAMCVETRPDVCVSFIDKMRSWGVTRVELGVQIIDNKIYGKINRGHKVKDVINVTRRLKNAGFKVGYHIMPGLPGSSLKKDYKLFKKLFSSSDFRPDQLKIYPCQVMPNSKLEKWYWQGKYKPYSFKETEKILIAMLKEIPRYCRVMRIMREIPPQYIIAGTKRIDLRREIERELRKKNFNLKEIRYREVGFAKNFGEEDYNTKLKVTKYKASGGVEYFLEIVNEKDILFGLCRLRIDGKEGIIRELHVYGKSLKLGEKGMIAQHKGFGKMLMKKAEEIAKKNNIRKLKIISGIGVREYYKLLGYKLEKEKGNYMVKFL
jgi:elongator complex protein 3